jgi:hypothetical protein
MEDRIILDDTPVGNYTIKPLERQPLAERKPDVNDSELRPIKPGLFESFYESFKEYTPEIQIGSGNIKKVQSFSLYNDPGDAPKIDTDVLEDFSQEYWAQILDAPTAHQQDIVKANIREDIADREYLESGSTVGRLVGGIAAFANPLSLMNKVPLQAGLKTLSASKSLISNIATSFPGMAGQALLTNTARAINHESMTLEDWGKDTAADAVFGSLFFGAMSIGQSLKLKGKLKSLNQMDPDISYAGKIGPKGEFAGWEARSNNGSAGAAKVSDAQKFVDEGLASFGEDPWFLKVFKGSPVVRGLSSPYLTVREWTGAMFRPSGLLTVKGMTQEGEMSAEQIAKGFADKAYHAEYKITKLWEKSNNIMPGSPLKDSLSAFKRLTSEGKYLSRDEFYDKISYGLENGNKSTNPAIQEGIDIARKLLDEVYENEVRLDILAPDLDPITQQTYLNIVYNSPKIAAEQNGFCDAIVGDLLKQSEEIRTIMGPIDGLKETKKLLVASRNALRKNKAAHSEHRNVLGNVRDELKKVNSDIASAQANLNENILKGRDGGIDPILVGERPFFTKAETAEYTELTEPQLAKETELSNKIESATKELTKLNSDLKKVKGTIPKTPAEFANYEKIVSEKIKIRKEELKFLEERHANVQANFKRHRDELKLKIKNIKAEFKDKGKTAVGIRKKRLQKKYDFKIKTANAELSVFKDMYNEANKASKKFIKIDKEKLSILESKFTERYARAAKKKDTFESRTKSYQEKNIAHKDKTEKDIKIKTKELENAKTELKESKDLFQRLLNLKHTKGTLNEKFYRVAANGTIKLRDPKAIPKLRKPMEPHEAKERALRAYYTTTQQNEEQMLAAAFKNKQESGTNPLMARTLMVRANATAPWREKNITKLLHLRTGFAAKNIAVETVLRRLGAVNAKDGQEAIIAKLSLENKTKLESLFDRQRTAEGKELKKINKEIAKQNKDFKKAEQFINKSWKAFWGNYNTDKYSDGVKSFLGGLRNWNVATSLGALPLMQASDAAMLIRNFGFGPVLKEAIFPHIASMFSAKNLVREDMAHANLGINTFLRAYGDQLFGVGEQYYKRGWLNRFSAVAANKFGNLTGSNQIEDALQLMGGTLSQSKTIATLKKHVAGGTLSQAEHERLFLLGLNKGMAERILAQHKEFGTTVRYPLGAKAYLANYEKWKDLDAANVMLNSIRQEVDATVLRPNLLDVPFCYKDPLMGSLMQFTSYAWASGNQRLLNIIQRPTGTKVMGELLATAVGAYINPTREFLEGKEPDFSTKALLASAVTNGFPGGIFVDYFNRANSVFNIPILNEFKSDRFRDKDWSQVLLGAPGSAGSDAVRLINTAFNVAGGGTASEYDMKKLAYRIPWTRAWWLRGGTNAMIEAMEFPKKREKMDKVFGDTFNSE